MKVDFDGLQAFVCVAELGSFVKAAQQLHLTQTALTRRIQKLEQSLDIRLLDRTTRKVELTATGRDFLPQARHLVLDAQRTLERVRDKARAGLGHFTLACVPSLTTHVLPQLIKAYAQSHPGNTLRLHDAPRTMCAPRCSTARPSWASPSTASRMPNSKKLRCLKTR